MPRVARRKEAILTNPPVRSPKGLPLNDDENEKAARLQSRQALHEYQLNQIRAAASPGHRQAQYLQSTSGPFDTDNPSNGENDTSRKGSKALGSANIKRVPILANFEEWMKMATDNKINATNSWNFALIDYFHDMSLLKEGDSVNFQKASCTLDGCVKIYTSRVDSVATETGKLLSGLADSGNNNEKDGDDVRPGDDDDNEENGDDSRKKPRKKAQRSSEVTLAASFSQLQLKRFELEFAVDPLFKKASADFDEGGAKGLLLNHLCIDREGRIVFDSSDDTAGTLREAPSANYSDEESTDEDLNRATNLSFDYSLRGSDIDLADLQLHFFPDLCALEGQDICPSLRTLDIGETMDPASFPIFQEHRKKQGEVPNNIPEDDPGLLGLEADDTSPGFETGFGTGGEIWAHEAGLEPMFGQNYDRFDRVDDRDQYATDEAISHNGSHFGITMHFGTKDTGHSDVFGYFDNTSKSSWAGPEHWRIRRMKRDTAMREGSKRKEREPFEINFQSMITQREYQHIHTSASNNSAISMPKSQWRSRTRHLLPDDKHFSSNMLLRLFLKPRARLNRRTLVKNASTYILEEGARSHVDNAYWARHDQPDGQASGDQYAADFFREDEAFPIGLLEDDADDFTDARETFTPAFDQDGQTSISMVDSDLTGPSESGYGSSLVTRSRRMRPEYVSYAKVAKRVDVRLLKEKLWKGIGLDTIPGSQDDGVLNVTNLASSELKDTPLHFTTVMNSLQDVYSPEAMADISTSYCFISLLHLANEKGLILSNEQDLEDLGIRRDHSAEVMSIA